MNLIRSLLTLGSQTSSAFSLHRFRLAFVAFLSFIASGCSFFNSETILPGKREAVFLNQTERTAGASQAPLSKATRLDSWLVASGHEAGAVGNIATGLGDIKPEWRISTGQGKPFAVPLVIGERVFVLSGGYLLSAWTIGKKAPDWRQSLVPTREKAELSGGGIASDGQHIYGITPFGEAIKVDGASGKIIWRKNLETALRGAPLVFDGKLFGTSSDGTIIALNTSDGEVAWKGDGIGESIGLISSNSPVARGKVVIAALRSGEVSAHDKETGDYQWSSGLSRGLPNSTLNVLSDISAQPIIDSKLVYASSIAGETVAIDPDIGGRLWSQRVGTTVPMNLSGDTLFVLGLNQAMMALNRKTGDIFWRTGIESAINQPASGFVLVDDSILIPGADGQLTVLSARTGEVTKKVSLGVRAAVAPVATSRGLFIYDSAGNLTLYQ